MLSREEAAIHEAGHAAMAIFERRPFVRISLAPQMVMGQVGGQVEFAVRPLRRRLYLETKGGSFVPNPKLYAPRRQTRDSTPATCSRRSAR